jgi:CelD/BcsL family acetyltransferase involved in cellulose biosynthesis
MSVFLIVIPQGEHGGLVKKLTSVGSRNASLRGLRRSSGLLFKKLRALAVTPHVRPQSAPFAGAARPPGAVAVDIARVDVFSSLPDARGDWIELEATAGASPYQAYAFAEAWFSTIGAATGARPYIVVARDRFGQPQALLPLARRRLGLLGVAAFLGGRDSNYNLGLFRPGVPWSDAALRSLLLSAARATPSRVDCFALQNQPGAWQGVTNPLAALGGRPSPSFAHKSDLPPSFAAWLDAHASKDAQKRLRRKKARLASMGPVTHVVATDEAHAAQFVGAVVAQKRQRALEGGPANPYESLEAQAFLSRLATRGLAEGRPTMELHALVLGDRVVAALGALAGRTRLSTLVLAHDRDPDIARLSPGSLLLEEAVRSAIERGFETFDLGVGEAPYKSAACETTEVLVDVFVAATALGRAGALVYGLRQRLKARVKRSPLLMTAAANLRAWLR